MVEMEKIQLEIFQKAMNEALNNPRETKQQAMKPLTDILAYSGNHNSTIESSISFYQNKLSQQINERRRNMPENGELYNVRFIEE